MITTFRAWVVAFAAGILGMFGGMQLEKHDSPVPPKAIFSDVDCDRAISSTTYNVAKGQEGVTSYQCVDLPNK